MRSAMQRFNWQHRIIKDEFGAQIGHAVPGPQDTRAPRAEMAGPTSGWLVTHADRNRRRRRELAREYGLTGRPPGTSRPVTKEELTARDIILIHQKETPT